jgi:hypothetical protein
MRYIIRIAANMLMMAIPIPTIPFMVRINTTDDNATGITSPMTIFISISRPSVFSIGALNRNHCLQNSRTYESGALGRV